MPHPLARIIEQLKREPSRTGSIVITLFGDAIVPRGGSVWLGTLLEFFQTIDIDSGVVRTAMSRLAADGWLERNKVGRNSFYRLADKGRLTFDAAVEHVYNPQSPDWTGRFELLLIANAGDREASREALQDAGFGSPLPGVWIAPSGVPVPQVAARAIRLEVSAEDDSGRRLLSESWPLRSHRRRLPEVHEDLRAVAGLDRPARAAFGRRCVHGADFADPLLSAGGAARSAAAGCRFCPRIGRDGRPVGSAVKSIAGLLSASEQWLDRNGSNENGSLAGCRRRTWAKVRGPVICYKNS